MLLNNSKIKQMNYKIKLILSKEQFKDYKIK